YRTRRHSCDFQSRAESTAFQAVVLSTATTLVVACPSRRNLLQSARALAVLKRAAVVATIEIVPLFRMAGADAADMAAEIAQRVIAVWADERRQRSRRLRGFNPLVTPAQDRPVNDAFRACANGF